MRRLGLVLLLAPAALAGELVEISSIRYVGYGVGIAAIAAGDGYLPAIQTQRADPRGHWRAVSLALGEFDDARLRGDAFGMDRHGGGVVMATLRDGEITVLEIRYEGARARSIDHGSLAIRGLKSARLLRIGSTPQGPLLIVGHAGGLVVAAVKPRGQGTESRIPVAGGVLVAATAPYRARAGSPADIFVVGNASRLLHLQQRGPGFAAVRQYTIRAGAFQPRALAGRGRSLWLAGARNGRAALALFDTAALRPRRGVLPDTIEPLHVLELGRGSLDFVRYLDARTLAVGGVQDGRSWVGVVRTGNRPALVHARYLPGTGVVALGVNPARTGWTLGAATREKTFHLLLAPGDRALPKNWDPFARPETVPPAKEPVAGPRPPREDPTGAVHAGPSARGEGTTALLPRVEADARRGVDTEIVLLYLGDRPRRVLVRFLEDDGRLAQYASVTLRPGERRRLSVSEELRRRRILRFDGYVRVEGGAKRTLVVEAAIRRSGDPPETVRAHWR